MPIKRRTLTEMAKDHAKEAEADYQTFLDVTGENSLPRYWKALRETMAKHPRKESWEVLVGKYEHDNGKDYEIWLYVTQKVKE